MQATITAKQPPERLMRLPELMQRIGRSRAMIYEDIAAGKFPKPVKLGRTSAWPESEVTAYIEARKAERDAN